MSKDTFAAKIEEDFEKIFGELLDDREEYGGEFSCYYRDLNRGGIRRWIEHKKDLLKNIDVRGKRIADVGCGCGMISLFMSMNGGEVYSLDNSRDAIEAFRRIRLRVNRNLGIHQILGNAERMPFSDKTLDIVFSNQAISHYHELEQFISESHRILKQSGILVIVDGNNALNPYVSWKTKRMWGIFENGSEDMVVCGRKIPKSYVEIRKEIIQKRFPNLNEDELKKLAEMTSGLWGKEIIDAVERYLTVGAIPENHHKTGCPYCSPIDGSYPEQLIDVLRLREILKQQGFKVEINAKIGTRKPFGYLNPVLDILGDFGLLFTREFRIIGEKM